LIGKQQKSLFAPEHDRAPWELDDAADRLFAEIVFNRPVDEVFVYEVPYPLRDRLAPGKRVIAPFGRGNERMTGYCIRQLDRAPRDNLKKLLEVVDDETLLTPVMLDLARWIAEHYCCAYGQALDAVLPGSVKAGAGMRQITLLTISAAVREQLSTLELPAKQRRVLEILAASCDAIAPAELARLARCTQGPIRTLEQRKLVQSIRTISSPRELPAPAAEPAEALQLNGDQQTVLRSVESRLAAGGFHAMLLHGVTGSGKTEIYLRAIDRVVRSGREAIVLVPEISLTPQTIRRFHSHFPHVAVLHSHLADSERHAQWRRIAAGQSQVVVGARSAIFAPTRRLGLIVIDEEHEGTFKQDTTPRYHARDVAWRRAELEAVPLLLGSATPSLESWHRAQSGRCELLELPQRVLSRSLPDVKLIDLRQEVTQQRRRGAISLPLEHAIRQALNAGGQVMLLLNRRGFSTHISCLKCGHVEKCRRCDIALVYHRDRSAAICHFCDLELPPPRQCSQCKDPGVNFRGLGTERLEQEVRSRFPGFGCQRMDTDSMRGRGSHERVLAAFRRGELRILLGTQMIAKGLDFPGVTLVGVINADTALHLPDFRAAERTFQLVAQVAGRTGRGEQGGRVLVQTFNPIHPAIQAAARHDFLSFAAFELPQRHEHGYPPFGQMARVIVRSRQERAAKEYIQEFAKHLTGAATQQASHIRVLGPAPAPVTRVKNLYRYHLQLQSVGDYPLDKILRSAISAMPGSRQVEIAVDVDPLAML
jgi:primosomal protein N' (replication factor Y)